MELLKWTIDGVEREAYVCFPKITPAPIMFAFHGHNGSGYGFSNQEFEKYWHEVIVVYPDGLPTKSQSDSLGVGSGWQHVIGEVNSLTSIKDQDLKFFDRMLLELSPLIFPQAVMVFGWSNGGFFVYNVLWPARGAQLAAISGASCYSVNTDRKVPKAILHIAGKTDPVVSFTQQQESFKEIRDLNQAIDDGTIINVEDFGLVKTRFLTKLKKPTVFIEYDNGHLYPSNVVKHIPIFFRNQFLKT